MGQKQFGDFVWEYERPHGLVKKPIAKEKKIFEELILFIKLIYRLS